MITRPDLIAEYAKLHKSKLYGTSAPGHLFEVVFAILDRSPRRLLEYGCGRSKLNKMIPADGVDWIRYDPAIPAFSDNPAGIYDLVICTDVLEHVPPEDVTDVLNHIKGYSDFVYINVSTRPAIQKLSDGRNAHLTVWIPAVWLRMIRSVYPDTRIASEARDRISFLTWNSPILNYTLRRFRPRSRR